MGNCQNYGPFLGPYYNTGPNTGPNLGDPKGDHNFDSSPHDLGLSQHALRSYVRSEEEMRRDFYTALKQLGGYPKR